jgi:hypothetical protein
MAITTNYSAYGLGYASALYTNGASTPVTIGTGDSAKQSTLATKLREDVAVEVTLSPAALQALATLATATTENTEEAIVAKLKSVLDEIFLNSTREANAAGKVLPKDPARRKVAEEAAEFLAGTGDNPFKGKGQSDLALIVVDPDRTYTINERRAAFAEFTKQDNHRLSLELEISEEGRAAADAEVPPSNDPARVANARKATDFLNDKGINPFGGKTRDELTAIIYNDTGDYTRNERLAALTERAKLEDALRTKLAATLSDAERRNADREKPASGSLAHLDRARQATHFTYGLSANPFAGLTPEELNAIIFDESKTYTLNERRAAHAELTGTTPATARAGLALQQLVPSLTDQLGAYGPDGAYSLASMRRVLAAQNTSMLLNLLNQSTADTAGQSSTSGGLLNGLFGL